MTKRILVVEDQEDNRQILRDLLSSADYEMDEAENGEEALAAVAKQRPDLILMDIQLPIMDGYEATRRIKAMPEFKSIPIIVVTSYALSGDEGKARETVKEFWPTSALEPPLMTDLMTPRHFEKAVEVTKEEKMTEGIVLGSNPQRHLDAIEKYVTAGFDHVYLHQIGPDQESFFKLYREKILPNFTPKQNGKHSFNGSARKHTNGRGRSKHA